MKLEWYLANGWRYPKDEWLAKSDTQLYIIRRVCGKWEARMKGRQKPLIEGVDLHKAKKTCQCYEDKSYDKGRA